MITLIAAATLSPTTLDNAFLVAAVYALVQWIIKPLIVSFWLPQNNPYQDNATRAAGFLVAFVLTLINAAVQHPLTAAQAWALLPTAAAIYASSALIYHLGAPLPEAAPSAALSAGARPSALIGAPLLSVDGNAAALLAHAGMRVGGDGTAHMHQVEPDALPAASGQADLPLARAEEPVAALAPAAVPHLAALLATEMEAVPALAAPENPASDGHADPATDGSDASGALAVPTVLLNGAARPPRDVRGKLPIGMHVVEIDRAPRPR